MRAGGADFGDHDELLLLLLLVIRRLLLRRVLALVPDNAGADWRAPAGTFLTLLCVGVAGAGGDGDAVCDAEQTGSSLSAGCRSLETG